jgi:AcrR family transcriptional regulator
MVKEEQVKTRKRLPAEERKKIILEAASRTFVELGYQKALMDTIAKRSGVTKPIIYRHFPSKLDLLLAILEDHASVLTRMITRPLEEYSGWEEEVEKDVRGLFEFVERYEMGYRLTFEGEIAQEPEVIERLHAIRQSIVKNVAKNVRQGTDPDKLSRRDVDTIAVIIVGMVETTSIYWLRNRDKPRAEYEDWLIWTAKRMLGGLPPRREGQGGTA